MRRATVRVSDFKFYEDALAQQVNMLLSDIPEEDRTEAMVNASEYVAIHLGDMLREALMSIAEYDSRKILDREDIQVSGSSYGQIEAEEGLLVNVCLSKQAMYYIMYALDSDSGFAEYLHQGFNTNPHMFSRTCNEWCSRLLNKRSDAYTQMAGYLIDCVLSAIERDSFIECMSDDIETGLRSMYPCKYSQDIGRGYTAEVRYTGTDDDETCDVYAITVKDQHTDRMLSVTYVYDRVGETYRCSAFAVFDRSIEVKLIRAMIAGE